MSLDGMFSPGCCRPNPEPLSALGAALDALAPRSAAEDPWRSGAFDLLGRHGFLAGFVPVEHGGTAADEAGLLAGLAAVAEHCLTTALVVSQWAAAVRIIAAGSAAVRAARLPALASGRETTTVGISQLTTSRQHARSPALVASRDTDGWRLDGDCPWVTGADVTDTIVTGAATAAGDPIFFVVPTTAPGLVIEPPLRMLALSGSRTSAVRFGGVRPVDVIDLGSVAGPRAGGLGTTALALGATRAAVSLVRREALTRPGLGGIVAGLDAETESIARRLHEGATAGIDGSGRDALRADATGLVVRAAQAALTTAKGAGFVAGHPAERLARESLFFLVWSCPQSVAAAVLCDLATGQPQA